MFLRFYFAKIPRRNSPVVIVRRIKRKIPEGIIDENFRRNSWRKHIPGDISEEIHKESLYEEFLAKVFRNYLHHNIIDTKLDNPCKVNPIK